MPKSELTIQIGKEGQTTITDVTTTNTPSDGVQNGSNQPEGSPSKPTTWGAKWRYYKEFITIEPLLFSYIFANSITGTAHKNLGLEKSCAVDLQYSDIICARIIAGEADFYNHTEEINTVHLNIADVSSWLGPVTSILPLVLSLFWGSYSDRYQIRKPFLILPFCGELLAGLFTILSTIFLHKWDLTTYLSLVSFSSTCFGGSTLLVVALFAYVADVSTTEQRTLRIGVCQIAMVTAAIAGSALSGNLFKFTGYYGVFCTSFVIFLFGICYGLFFIKDNLISNNEAKKCLVLDLFDPTLIVETARVLIVKRNGNNRMYIVLFMIIFFIYNGLINGENGLIFFYLNGQLGFDSVKHSYLETFQSVMTLKGTIVGTYLFTKVLKLSDYLIIIVVYVNYIIGDIVWAVSVNKIMIYIGSYIQLFNNLSIIALRSLETKVVRQEDLGKVQSLFAIWETMGGVVFIPIYNKLIFANTQVSFPSAFLYAPILFLGICILIVIFMRMKDQQNESNGTNNAKDNKQGIDNNAMVMSETQISRM